MKKILTSIVAASVAFTFSNCSTIVSKPDYDVNFKSANPAKQVAFKVKNSSGSTVHSATTPSVANLSASEGFFKKAEYTVVQSNGDVSSLKSKVGGSFIANFISWGIPGMVVDGATGDMWKLPKEVEVK